MCVCDSFPLLVNITMGSRISVNIVGKKKKWKTSRCLLRSQVRGIVRASPVCPINFLPIFNTCPFSFFHNLLHSDWLRTVTCNPNFEISVSQAMDIQTIQNISNLSQISEAFNKLVKLRASILKHHSRHMIVLQNLAISHTYLWPDSKIMKVTYWTK